MVFTSVGRELSVGADPVPDACAGYQLIVLAAKEFQHHGDSFPCEVLRVPLSDDDEAPSMDEIKRATTAAEKIAYANAPFCVPYDLFKKYAPKVRGLAQPISIGDEPTDPYKPKRALITCEEGLNRSLWLAGMVLVLTGEREDGADARRYLEDLRGPGAFRNKHLARLLDRYMPASLKPLRQKPVSLSDAEGISPGGYSLKP
jgi:hypothetical protein